MVPSLAALRRSLHDVRATAQDLARGLVRPSFRAALGAELALSPLLVTAVVPWLVKTRPGEDVSLVKQLLENAAHAPHALALEMDDERLTWSDFADRTSRYAHALSRAGVRRGDVVALLGHNSPSYLAVMLGIARIGATAALVNSRLEGQPLSHAVLASKARVAVVEAALAERVRARDDLSGALSRVFTFRPGDLDDEAARAPSAAFPREVVPCDSDFVYIYTSGTTGLPKPVRVTHARVVLIGALAGNGLFRFGEGDKLYIVMPLYHSSALWLGFSAAMMTQTPIALRESFSARAFWGDVRRYRATATLYIGELCRYLMNSPPSPFDKEHTLRIMVGNGLRADLWKPFVDRFGVREIREFYGATEAPGAIVNLTGKVGSVGRMPGRRLSPLKIVRYDVETGTHPRDARGVCIECGPREVGELVVTLSERPISALAEFRGYTDAAATQKKIVRDVVVPGDRAFRSGDLLYYDEDDFFYFVDRIGDTFRFKGENVSTAEVADVLSRAPGIKHVAVVGVELPGVDGRAGFAAVECEAFDAESFWKTAQELPDYAQPRLVRRVASLDTTATFKIQKTELGNGARWNDGETWLRLDGRYTPLTAELAARVEKGEVRVS